MGVKFDIKDFTCYKKATGTMLNEILDFLHGLFEKLLQDIHTFNTKLIFAALLSVSFWILCGFYSRLWNRRFKVTPTHHLVCAIAAVSSFVFALAFFALKYSEEVAVLSVQHWQHSINSDSRWQNEVFVKAYNAVKALDAENFSGYPPPAEGGNFIPSQYDSTKKRIASIYANAAVDHFNSSHRYLSKFLWADPDQSSETINRELVVFFQKNPGEKYDLRGAISLAAEHIQQGITQQIPRFVLTLRVFAIILFTFTQAIPFGMIGYAAYKDLKITL